MTKKEKARINRERIEHEILYTFMREHFGYEDDTYPSDVLYHWEWQYVDEDGEFCKDIDYFDRMKHAHGMFVKGWRTMKDAENGICKSATYFFKDFEK